MSSKGLDKSAASVQAKSCASVEKIYPLNGSKTVGLIMNQKEALKLARNIIMLVLDEDVKGYITITGNKKCNSVSVLGRKRKTYRR